MTVLKRKMFRKKGGSKGTGIMASGPELLKRFNGGGVNVPGGGSVTQRSGYPSVSAFGHSIPSIVQPPGAVKVPDQLGFYKIPGLGVGTPIPKSPIATFIGPNRTRFGKSALEQLAETESAVGSEVGPFPKYLSPSEQKDIDIKKSSSEHAMESGFRNLSNASVINDKLKQLSSSLGAKGLLEDYDVTDPEMTTVTGPQKDKKENKTIYEQSTDTTVNNEAETVDLSGGSVNKGSGKEKKGSGKANTTPNSEMGTKYKGLAAKMLEQMKSGKTENATDNSLITHGYKKEDVEEMTEKEKIVEMKAMLSNFGQNTEETEDLSGLNIMMLGLSIAAGDSPDALTNIAKGAKDFVGQRSKEIKQKIKDRKDREDAMDLLAIKTVLGRTDKKEDRKFQSAEKDKDRNHDMKKISTMNANDMVKLGMEFDFKKMISDNANNLQLLLKDKDIASRYDLKKLDVAMFNASAKNSFNQLTAKLRSAEMIARNAQLGQDQRAAAALEASNLRSVISNFDKGYGFAFYQGAKDGLEGEALAKYVEENGKRFASNSLLTGPDSIRRMIINNAGLIMKEQDRTFEEAAKIIFDTISLDPKLSVMFKKDLQAYGINVDATNQNKNTDTSGKKAPIDLTSK